MNPILLFLRYFLILFGYEINTPARLEKKEPESKFTRMCNTIAPYVIVVALVIVIILLLIILIRYGGALFGTEANRFYYGELA